MSNDVVLHVPHLADLLKQVEADMAAHPAPALQPAPEPAAEAGPALTFEAALASVDAGPVGEPEAATVPTMPDTPPPGSAEGERAGASALAEIGAQALRLGVAIDVQAAIAGGVEPEAVRRRVIEAAAARARATAICTSAPDAPAHRAGPAVERGSPIVDLARRQRDQFDRERGGR